MNELGEAQLEIRQSSTAKSFLPVIILVVLVVTLASGYWLGTRSNGSEQVVVANKATPLSQNDIASAVIPASGVVLPIKWNSLGKELVDTGVIDYQKFVQLFSEGLTDEEQQILYGTWDGPITLTPENSRFVLDLLWAFGLGNKNSVLDAGDMVDPKYGGADRFASTGGWNIAKGDVMDHYSKHEFVALTPKQQALVEEVAKGIYRPCCGNSTYFPDCNHGMAMLGLLELMAATGATRDEMFATALKVNSIWFPQTYTDLAVYFAEQGVDWKDVDPELVLSKEYSSASGYYSTREKIKSLPTPANNGGSCGT